MPSLCFASDDRALCAIANIAPEAMQRPTTNMESYGVALAIRKSSQWHKRRVLLSIRSALFHVFKGQWKMPARLHWVKMRAGKMLDVLTSSLTYLVLRYTAHLASIQTIEDKCVDDMRKKAAFTSMQSIAEDRTCPVAFVYL
eukprot:6212249-Pleurochrysis_carterae.AAC.1